MIRLAIAVEGKRSGESVEELVGRIDESLDGALGENRNRTQVFAYVQRHEFEALLFSKVDAFDTLTEASPASVRALHRIRADFPTPEDINDTPESSPSRRILDVIVGYQKRANGPPLAQEIGLSTIRAECPRFDDWVRRLELLGEGS